MSEQLYCIDKSKISLEESINLLAKQNQEIARLKSDLSTVINERDLLLCEVSKLKFELEIADLKRIHDERPLSMRNRTALQACMNGSINNSQECDSYQINEEEDNREIDDDLDDFNQIPNVPPMDPNVMQYVWHNHRLNQHNNTEPVTTSRNQSGYELSQELLDKQIELLERKYGGARARKAALVIQKAFRRYMLLKKFAHITAMAKAEKRMSRRLQSCPEDKTASLIHAESRSSYAVTTGAPVRSLSMREKRFGDVESGSNSLPRSYSNRNTDNHNNPMANSQYCSDSGAIICGKGHVCSESPRKTHSCVQCSMSSVQHYQMASCHRRVVSQSHYQNSPQFQMLVTHSQLSTPVKKVPPEVPKRTSSISLRSAEPQHGYLSPAECSFSKTQYSGSVSSVQSSSSDSSIALNGHMSNLSSIPSTSYSSSSPSSFGAKTQVSEALRKRQYRVGLNLFNKKPEKGILYLVKKGFLEHSPQAVAKFLIARKGLSKQMIGEYLGNVQNPFNSAVLECFARELDLSGMQVDVALRKFQMYFRMPGEAQKIERLMEVFSHRYCHCNRDVVSRLRSLDTVFVLAFAIIMLNTDLHTPSLKADKRMKLEDFIKNLRGIDDCCDIDRNMLVGIYERIKANEFKPGSDHVSQVMKVQSTIVGKKPNLALAHRRLVCYCRLYEVPDVNKKDRPGVHQREVFLFNDLLVITKILNKKKTIATYTFRQSYSLSGLVINVFETQYYPYGIRLSQRVDNHVLVTFNARNDHDRMKFVDDIRESILEMDEMENIRIEAELDRQKAGRSNRCGSTGDSTDNRDSGVADVEGYSYLHNAAGSYGSRDINNAKHLACGSVVDQYNGATLKRSTRSNSLLDIHDQV